MSSGSCATTGESVIFKHYLISGIFFFSLFKVRCLLILSEIKPGLLRLCRRELTSTVKKPVMAVKSRDGEGNCGSAIVPFLSYLALCGLFLRLST